LELTANIICQSMRAAMSLIHNQRIKLTAGWLNGLAGAAAAAGTIALLVAGFYGAATAPISKSLLLAGAGFWSRCCGVTS
jgi:hypothetical protein